MIAGGQGTAAERFGASSGGLKTRVVSKTATGGSVSRTMVFGEAPGSQATGVNAGFIFVGEGVEVIWSLPSCRQRRLIARNG